jgi:hypothetical protein
MHGARPAIPDVAERWAPVLFAFAVGVATAAYSLSLHAFPDFIVFWTAARHAADPLLYDGAHLTALQAWMPGSGPRPFIYPPTFLLLAWPFSLMPALTAYLVWSGSSCAALTLAAQQIVRPTWATAMLPICLPVAMALGYGQSTPFAAAALIAGAAQLARRPQLAGALIAAGACIKPQLMILSPLLLIGDWRALRAAILTGSALVIASLAFGPSQWLAWMEALPRFQVTVRQMPLEFINPLDPRLGLVGKSVVICCGVAFGLWCARRTPAERVVGVIAGSLCCTLYAVRTDVVALAPSALAWVLGGRAAADWVRRSGGLALIAGLIAAPVGVVVFMAAVAVAGLLRPAAAPRSGPPADAASLAEAA